MHGDRHREGYTAALAIHRMEQNGQRPEGGEIVTGATGGVGSVAIDMLAGRGYKVVALTGKKLRPSICRSSAQPAFCCAKDSISARARSRKRSGAARSTISAATCSRG